MPREHNIIFEDLHGVNEDASVTVDLNAGTKDDGIERTPSNHEADPNDVNDDGPQFDDLRTAKSKDDTSERADTEEDEEGGASNSGDDKGYSKKVRARIERATSAEKKAKQEAASVKREAEYWKEQSQKIAEASFKRDKTFAEGSIQRADVRIEETQSRLEKAIEDGRTKDQVALTTQLTDLKAEKVQAEIQLENLSLDGFVQPFNDKVEESTEDDASLARDWKENQSDWYGTDEFKRETRYANRIDRELYSEGYDPKSEEYFKELDLRLKEKYPDLYDEDGGEHEGKERKRPKRSIVAGAETSEVNRQKKKSGSKVELNEVDFANMRRFNLDVNDPEVLKEYARNKRQGAN